ncbi:LacI family DNA-binding transcriptional regulator [Galbitalea sp. SE-J8]|uniref:LacI family DNA-binding transcriptional regulator n=1 Tax=Galbitalea sp. SE-J8 TaxID=3054952 RepID=UPI00259CC30C|nr:LacI family DNA-binding transcriptional regulator [Galbitalea sp. SE-J8]MDM4762202.1 LacI family DNA-binding transcriptional regulator [Galbitalea sp. SE-J8]
MKSQNPTMVDVAREARVSVKTVSRFVNGETNIDPVLAGRIASAIEGLGYYRNLAAASIRPGWTSRMIGVVISDLANPFYSTLARAIEEAAGAQGYLLIIASSEEDGPTHDRVVDRLMEQRVDGLIVVPPRTPGRAWADVRPSSPALVMLDRPLDAAGADIILADNAGGARSGTEELLRHGARRIAFVGAQHDVYSVAERHRGYSQALTAAGLRPDDISVSEVTRDAEHAAALIERLVETDATDAIFAANNRAAIGALLAFRRLGRRLPLIGFDDFEAAPLAVPAVSVVRQDVNEMGRLAAELVIRRATGRGAPATTHTLPTSLVLRGSELPG